jgi:phosphoenolpyruvate---glycerone phosphotransferase subunit DhaL
MASSDVATALKVLEAICDRVEREKDHLCEVDAALGDGDHGISMSKSFSAVRTKLREVEGSDLSGVLSAVGMTLVSEVGGAMGPLFGTAFMRAGKAVAGKQSVSAADLAQMLAAAEAGIVQRGKAQPGDKTMLDAVHPAALAAQKAASEGADLLEALQAAAAAAAQGVEDTKAMVAKVGRASRLGERSVGHQDAGATSVSIILQQAFETLASIQE